VRTSTVLPWLSLAGRLVLGGVFAVAALTKIADPQATVRAVRAYDLVPEAVVQPLGYALPFVELVLALLLVIGLGVRVVVAGAALLLVLFIGGVASAWARGLRIDCGCFGGGGVTDDPKYAVEIVRDVALLGAALVVGLVRRSALSLDNALEV
jgi:uncharacterized membrane protein YphA (DoxX/SURF4 family)